MRILDYVDSYITDNDVDPIDRLNLQRDIKILINEDMRRDIYSDNYSIIMDLPSYEKQKFIYDLCDYYLLEGTTEPVASSSVVYSPPPRGYLSAMVPSVMRPDMIKGITKIILSGSFILSIFTTFNISWMTGLSPMISTFIFPLLGIYVINQLLSRKVRTGKEFLFSDLSRFVESAVSFVYRLFSYKHAMKIYSSNLIISIRYKDCTKRCNIHNDLVEKLKNYFKRIYEPNVSTTDYGDYYLNNIERKQIECFENCSLNVIFDMYTELHSIVEKCKKGLQVTHHNSLESKVLSSIDTRTECNKLQTRLNDMESDIQSIMSYVYQNDPGKLIKFQQALDEKKNKSLQKFTSISTDTTGISRGSV